MINLEKLIAELYPDMSQEQRGPYPNCPSTTALKMSFLVKDGVIEALLSSEN